MSSAENGRLVWLTRAQIETIAYLAETVRTSVAVPLHQVVAACEAAPVNPAEAIAAELREIWDDHSFMAESREDAAKVLRALGVPAPPQRPTPKEDA